MPPNQALQLTRPAGRLFGGRSSPVKAELVSWTASLLATSDVPELHVLVASAVRHCNDKIRHPSLRRLTPNDWYAPIPEEEAGPRCGPSGGESAIA